MGSRAAFRRAFGSLEFRPIDGEAGWLPLTLEAPSDAPEVEAWCSHSGELEHSEGCEKRQRLARGILAGAIYRVCTCGLDAGLEQLAKRLRRERAR